MGRPRERRPRRKARRAGEGGGGRLRGPEEHAALAAASLFWRFRLQPQPARSSALPLGDWAGAGLGRGWRAGAHKRLGGAGARSRAPTRSGRGTQAGAPGAECPAGAVFPGSWRFGAWEWVRGRQGTGALLGLHSHVQEGEAAGLSANGEQVDFACPSKNLFARRRQGSSLSIHPAVGLSSATPLPPIVTFGGRFSGTVNCEMTAYIIVTS